MLMPWFFPLALGVGYVGTRTSLRARHTLKGGKRDSGWWMLLIVAWLPCFCWIASQLIDQY
jgi:hypothetical protein